MDRDIRTNRWSQIVGWVVFSLFLLGFFYSPIGAWTGPILGVWFIGTQKPRRGLAWVLILNTALSLIFGWRGFLLADPLLILQHLGWVLFAILMGALPLSFHRLTSPRLPGLVSTLPFPLANMALPALAFALHIGPAHQVGVLPFLVSWFAAVVVWMWNAEFKASKIGWGASLFAVLFAVAYSYALWAQRSGAPLPSSADLGAFCLFAALACGIWALFNSPPQIAWSNRQEAVARLRSPFTGASLQVAFENGRESLLSQAGERFPIRNGIPTFLSPEDLTGDNGKYNHLYETIGGFYNDIQRVFSPLMGFDLQDYFLSYMRLLEVKPGDSVLETSVGTGLNFKYLPSGVKLSGLDLSPEMLANCQTNLRCWDLEADLYLGNAESLPFADNSFDVVFHVGGINFFNNRAKAIREMIRVAKPGSLLLISDETEKHVREVYERQPGGMFKDRKEPVQPPVDLVPVEMLELQLETLKNGNCYALTFRKPPAVGQAPAAGPRQEEGAGVGIIVR